MAGIFCVRTLRCGFTVEAIKNSRFSSPRNIVSCFAMMFVLLWEFLAMNNPDQWRLFLIRQKWAWKWFYSTMKTDSPPFLWLMQPTWRKVMNAWNFCWERLSMTNLSGSYVVVSSLWHCYLECNSGTKKYYCFLCQWDSRDKKNHYAN